MLFGKSKKPSCKFNTPQKRPITPRPTTSASAVAHGRKYMIAFDDIDAVPVVFVDGKQVHGLVDVQVNWHTKEDWATQRTFSLAHYQMTAEGIPMLITQKQPDGHAE